MAILEKRSMELLFLDEQFRLMSAPVDDYRSLQWVRRYHKCGQFTLILSPRLYDMAMAATYVYNNATDETAIITGRRYMAGGGEEIELTGFMLEHMLSWRCVEKPEVVSGDLESEIRRMVEKYAMTGERALPRLSLAPPLGFAQSIDAQVDASDVATWLYGVLQPYGMSYRLYYDYDQDSILFSLWQGRDRTQGNAQGNQPAVFSSDFENITNITYTRDEQDYKNLAYVVFRYTPDPVVGEDDEEIRQDEVTYTEVVDWREAGEQRREIYVSPSGLDTKDEEGEPLPESQIRAAMRQVGGEELEKHKRVQKAEGELHDTAGLSYRTGFDLGDICDFIIPQRGLLMSARITQVTEVYESGILRVEPVLGEDYLTIREMIKRGR